MPPAFPAHAGKDRERNNWRIFTPLTLPSPRRGESAADSYSFRVTSCPLSLVAYQLRVPSSDGGFIVTVHGDCPSFRGRDDVSPEIRLCRRENGTVPLGRKGTGTFFGLRALTWRND